MRAPVPGALLHRLALLAPAAAALAPAAATATPAALPPTVVYKDRVHRPAPGVRPALISRRVYVNDCRPNGCLINPGADDSRTNRSSIPQQQVRLEAWHHGDALWEQLVQCVRDTFLPFDIEVVTTDPGTASHFEVMVGGSATDLDPELVAGGVAPFVGCGGTEDNVISFVFARTTNDLEYLCGAVAQEAAHVWGLDHELNALDPMTYLQLGTLKRFQNDDALCGEELDAPRECWCGGTRQNSYTYLADLFGLADLPPPTLTIETPRAGRHVPPGFPVRATLDSILGETSATLAIDGAEAATLTPGPFAFNAPATLAPGRRTITVTGLDGGRRSASASVEVTVMKACPSGSGCPDDTVCLGGYCQPGPGVAGGLGAACEDDGSCKAGACGQGGDERRCTLACDAGERCPGGFTCLGGSSGGGVCWPSGEEGGCAAGGPGGPGAAVPWLLSLAAGALLVTRRPRRRR